MWSSRVASAISNGKVESKDDRSHIMVLAKFAKAARGVMKRGAVGRGGWVRAGSVVGRKLGNQPVHPLEVGCCENPVSWRGWDLVDKGIWDQAPMLLVDMDICR